jgi:hypothetical protein
MPKIQKNEADSAKCSCPDCPSYNACAKGKTENLYCADENGKSSCQYAMNGCLCGACPVHATYSLKMGYYCLNGTAEQIG